MRLILAVIAIGAPLAVRPAGGQSPSMQAVQRAVRPGQRVRGRLAAGDSSFRGYFAGVARDTLQVVGCSGCFDATNLALADIAELEAAQPHVGAGRVVRHAAWGLLIGGAAGLVIGKYVSDRDTRTQCNPGGDFCSVVTGMEYPIIGALGGLLGLTVGGVSAVLRPEVRWERVSSSPGVPGDGGPPMR